MREFRFIREVYLILLQISSASSDFFPIKAIQSGNLADTAMNAVDNNPATCSLAAESDEAKRTSATYGWLQVDLGNPFLVISVTLTNANNGGDSQYLQNFVIFVSRSNSTDVAQSSGICAQFNNGSSVGAGTTITFTCNNALIGRYVTIKRQVGYRQDAISICEVSIAHNPSEGFIYLYNLPTNQSGAYNGQSPDRAVDLDVNSCAQPEATGGAKGWWSIDLQKTYAIKTVIVFNENTDRGSAKYAKEFEVWVGSQTDANSQTLCNNFTGSIPTGGNVTLDCSQPSVGRLVNITRWGSDNTKTIFLCEIYIKGYLSDGSVPPSTSLSTSTSSTTKTSTSSTTTTSTVSSTSVAANSGTKPSSSSTSTTTSTITRTSGASSSSHVTHSSRTSEPTLKGDNTSSSQGNGTQGKVESGNGNRTTIICSVVIILGLAILIALGIFLFFYLRKRRQNGSKIIDEDRGVKIVNTKRETIKPIPPVKPLKPSPLQRQIRADELLAYVERMKNGDDLKTEFKKLTEEIPDQAKIGKRSVNTKKNRFRNILPYDHTLVSLATKESFGEDRSYINANYIKGYKNVEKMYIATQGPKEETLNDFWRMIWQENVDLIVMTTLLREQGKNKCEQYWPAKLTAERRFDNISVRLTREDIFANQIYREMDVQDTSKAGNEKKQSRIVRQMHFLFWEDKQKPKDYLPVLAFRKKVRSLQLISSQPVVVHCSAGVGRTGTYIALDTLLEQLENEHEISFFKCVDDLRRQRMNMVQTWKQYSFLHEAVADHYQTGDTAIPCDSFAAKHKELLKRTHKGSKLEQQFEMLQRLKDPTSNRESAGDKSENINKNRNKDIVAYDDARPYLDVNYDESDYINATYVEGLRSKEAFVLTQLPLEDTIVDFWRLLWDHSLKIVVLLDGDAPDIEFWPDEGETQTHGPFSVTTLSVTEPFPSIISREFSIKNTSQAHVAALSVKQYQISNWSSQSLVPKSPKTILPIISEFLTNNSKASNKSILFQCTDGAVKSGLMAAAMYVTEMIKEERIVDIFYACRIVALNRPQAVGSLEQYLFLHDLASVCINSDDFDASNIAFSTATEGEYSNVPNSIT